MQSYHEILRLAYSLLIIEEILKTKHNYIALNRDFVLKTLK